MILFCSTQDLNSSRTRVLLELLNKNFAHKIFSIKKKESSVFKLWFKFFRNVLNEKPKLLILGFNSRLLIIPIIFLSKIFNFKVIYDIGYPITDIPDFSFFRRNIFSFLDYLAIKTFDLILLESTQQSSIYNNQNISKMVLFSNITFPKKLNNNNLNLSNYFLFRGRLNEESGIIECVNFFNNYKIKGDTKLVIHGWGKLMNEIKELVNISPSNIILIDKFLEENDMLNLIANCKAMIGQSKKKCIRLQKTIPHKCFEAIFFEKPYLSYLYDPIYEIFGNNYKKHDLQLEFNRSNFESLFHKIDSMDSFDLNETAKKVKMSFSISFNNQKNNLIKYIDECIKN